MDKKVMFVRYLLILASVLIYLGNGQYLAFSVEPSNTDKDKLSAEVSDYCQQGFQAIANNDIDSAQKLFVLAMHKPGVSSLPEMAEILEGLSFVQMSHNQLDQAANNLKHAISIYEKQPPAISNSKLVRPLGQLGLIYGKQHKDKEQKAAFSSAIKAGAAAFGPTVYDGAYVSSLLQLGLIYKKEGQFLQAEALLRHALDLTQHAPSKSTPNYNAIVVDNLADVIEKEGRQFDAAALRTNRRM